MTEAICFRFKASTPEPTLRDAIEAARGRRHASSHPDMGSIPERKGERDVGARKPFRIRLQSLVGGGCAARPAGPGEAEGGEIGGSNRKSGAARKDRAAQ
jgi:hypothetical protein